MYTKGLQHNLDDRIFSQLLKRSSAISGAPLASGPETPDGFKGQNKTNIKFRRPNPVGDFLGALASPLDGEMAPLAWVEHIDGVTMDEMEVEAVVIDEVTNDEVHIRDHGVRDGHIRDDHGCR